MSGALSPVGVQVNNGPIYPAGNAADTLNGEDFAILSVAVSNGG